MLEDLPLPVCHLTPSSVPFIFPKVLAVLSLCSGLVLSVFKKKKDINKEYKPFMIFGNLKDVAELMVLQN